MPLPRLTGYCAVFNSQSEDMGFREYIMPGAFDRALREKHDVLALVNHEPSMLLARTRNKTLGLTVDAKGLRADIQPPETETGRSCVELVRLGTLDAMSFAFVVAKDGEEWEVINGELTRRITAIARLADASIVCTPAYTATNVGIADAAPQRGVPMSINRLRLRMSSC